MSKVEIKLNSAGIRELRHCEGLEELMTQKAHAIASRCSGNYEVKAPFKGKFHSNVEVVTADNDTFFRNLHNNELLKATK